MEGSFLAILEKIVGLEKQRHFLFFNALLEKRNVFIIVKRIIYLIIHVDPIKWGGCFRAIFASYIDFNPPPPSLKHADFTATLHALNFLTSLYIGKSFFVKRRENSLPQIWSVRT